jgi:hypothetical protein
MQIDTLQVNKDSLFIQNKDTIQEPVVIHVPFSSVKTNILIDNATERGSDPHYVVYANSYDSEPWSDIINIKNLTFSSLLLKKQVFTYHEEYKGKNSKIYNKKITIHPVFNISDLSLMLIITSFVLVASIKALYSKYLNQLMRAIISYSEAYKLYRDYNVIIDRVYFVLNLNFIITGSLFGFYFLKLFKPSFYYNSNMKILLFCSSLILCIYFSRYLINKLAGFLLDQKQAFNEFLHSNLLYYKVTGLFLLPIASFLFLVSDQYHIILASTGIALIFIIYLISIYRATTIMLKKGILLFYWILYLCTIEFLPLLLLYKFFKVAV